MSTREPRFHRPYAHKVPITVESTVAQSAMITLFHVPSIICGSLKIAPYHCSEKCSQRVNFEEEPSAKGPRAGNVRSEAA